MSDMTILLILFVASGTLLSALSVPLVARKVRPNGWYGFRLQPALQDPDLWYRVNAYSGRWLFASGLLTVTAAVGLALVPGLSPDQYAMVCAAAILGSLGVGLFRSYRYMATLEREKERGG